MSTFTENYNLTLPEQEDYYDVDVFNDNFDALDNVVGTLENAVENVNEKLGEPTTEGTTVFSLLEKSGGSLVKSIQRVVHNVPLNATNASININTVNPEKCIVLFERLANSSNWLFILDYEVTSESIELYYESASSGNYCFGFTIVEFY